MSGKPNGAAAMSQQQRQAQGLPNLDNLNDQLSVIMVQMGRIMKTHASNPDRAEQIIHHSKKKMSEARTSYRETLDMIEFEIMRAKSVFRRDLEELRARNQAAAQQVQVPPAAPAVPQPKTQHAQPPAPMVIDLDGLKPSGPSVPVAPMMANGGSPFVAARGVPNLEGKPSAPVAPFPDMGMGIAMPAPPPVPSPVVNKPVPFSRAKPPVEQPKRPSPKQPTPKQTPKPAPKANPKSTPKSNPPSGRMVNKPNPMAGAKQPPKPPATAPPSAPAVAPVPVPVPVSVPVSLPQPPPVVAPAPMMPAAPMPPVPVPAPAPAPSIPQATPVVAPPTVQAPPAPMGNVPPQNPFTNAMFTVDPSGSDPLMQPGGAADINLDAMLDIDSFGGGGPGDASNMEMSNAGGNQNDTTMTDLDHFFDMSADSNTNFDESNFNDIDYMAGDFANFGSFE